jgi:hypothetical protein
MKAVLALLLIFSGLEVAYLVISGKLGGSTSPSPSTSPTVPVPGITLPNTGPSSNFFMSLPQIVPGASSGAPAGGLQFL